MATMPGLDADVFWGDPDKPPPDWRDHPIPDADDESDDPTPERKRWVCAVSGIDSSELWPSDDDESSEDTPTESDIAESAADTGLGRLARRAAELWESEGNYP